MAPQWRPSARPGSGFIRRVPAVPPHPPPPPPPPPPVQWGRLPGPSGCSALVQLQAAPAARQLCSMSGPAPPSSAGAEAPGAGRPRPAGVGRVAGGDAGHGADALHLQHPAGRTAFLRHACHIVAMAPALPVHRRCPSTPKSAILPAECSPAICSKRCGISFCGSRTKIALCCVHAGRIRTPKHRRCGASL